MSEKIHIHRHDEKFAREIQSMDDREWDDWGDQLQKPMPRGGDLGIFELYVKVIYCSSTWLAAVGIALLDSVREPEEPLVKVQKLIVGENVGRESIEALALIEGLTMVFALGFLRVEVFVDNLVFYNHITRRWVINHCNIAVLIEKAWSLQQKFERCTIGFGAKFPDAICISISMRCY